MQRRRFLRGHLVLALALSGAGSPAVAGRVLPGGRGGPDSLLPGGRALPGGGTGGASSGPLIIRRAIAFGTRIAVTVAGADPAHARRAADAALAEIAAIEASVSLHAPRSALARLNRDGRLDAADPHLTALLQEALRWGAATDGAFDVTVQPLWRLYFAAAARGGVPDDAAVERMRALVDWRSIRMRGASIVLERAGMQATLNGLAQGYATDRAWQVLREHGIEHALVDAGEWRASGRHVGDPHDGGPLSGDLPSGDPHDGDRPWQLGIRDPLAPPASAGRPAALLEVIPLQDAALATSGSDEYRFTADGRLYHILDPRTGRSPAELAGVTVLAPDACTADALSTACMVLGIERSIALIDAQPGVAALLVRSDGRQVTTAGWPTR